MNKNWIIGLVILGLLSFGIYKFWQYANIPTPAPESNVQIVLNDTDHTKGSATPSATLVEYGDFQCPACAVFAPSVKALSEEFSNDLQVVYRHFPLTNIHNNATNSAKAAEAAGKQDKFWEMHDLLYANQKVWEGGSGSVDVFADLASQIEGLDVERFKTDFDSQETSDKVDADVKSGNLLVVNATPTFFLNGRKMTNLTNFDDFRNRIVQAIEASE